MSSPRARAGVAPRVGQQHQRQQAFDVAFVREPATDGSCQPDRFARQIASLQLRPVATRVALVEDQIQDVQHATQVRLLLTAGGQTKWNS